MYPLISIIIPTKGCINTISRAIFSVVNQTYNNIECINVDFPEDGFGTKVIIEKHFNSYKNVFYFKSDKPGLGYQRNMGVSKAKGDYIIFLDGDDTLDKFYVEKMFNAIIKHNCDFACCSYKKLDESGRVLKEKGFLKPGIFSSEELLIKMYSKSHTTLVVCTCKLGKKSTYQKYPINEEVLNEDEASTYVHFYNSKKIVVLNEQLYNYYDYSNSLSKSHLLNMDKQVNGLLSIYKKRYELFSLGKNKRLSYLSYKDLLQNTLSYAYLFKKKKHSKMENKCKNVFVEYFSLRKFIAHPCALFVIVLKYMRLLYV